MYFFTGGNNAELFRNRKGYFSVNVQTISDANLKILDVVARWPGSTHDQTIFDNSNIRQRLLNNEFRNSLIVADSGYTNTMHIITPLLEANTEAGQLYNEAGMFVYKKCHNMYTYMYIFSKSLLQNMFVIKNCYSEKNKKPCRTAVWCMEKTISSLIYRT